jgi:hypothetical protein
MASRQGLKPAKRPAAKTVAAEDTVRYWRAFSEEHVGGVTTGICELSPAKAGDRAMTNAAVSKIDVMQYRRQFILTFLGGGIITFRDDPIEGLALDYLQILPASQVSEMLQRASRVCIVTRRFLATEMILR